MDEYQRARITPRKGHPSPIDFSSITGKNSKRDECFAISRKSFSTVGIWFGHPRLYRTTQIFREHNEIKECICFIILAISTRLLYHFMAKYPTLWRKYIILWGFSKHHLSLHVTKSWDVSEIALSIGPDISDKLAVAITR